MGCMGLNQRWVVEMDSFILRWLPLNNAGLDSLCFWILPGSFLFFRIEKTVHEGLGLGEQTTALRDFQP